jgi:hypothetical protein
VRQLGVFQTNPVQEIFCKEVTMTATATLSRKSWAGTDVYLAILLPFVFLTGIAISLSISGTLTAANIHLMQDLWFDADTQRVFDNLTDRYSDHYRTSVHPLASLLLSTPTIILKNLGFSPELAARFILAIGAGLLAATFFYLCNWVTGRAFDALVYTLLLMTSASFLCFGTVFELYAWGSFSILAALSSATVTGRYKGAALVIGSAVSLSITVTNWMAGLAATYLSVPIKRAALYSALAFATVAAFTAVQSNLYPTSGKFLYFKEEQNYTKIDIRQKLQATPKAFFLDPIIFPGVVVKISEKGKTILTAERPDGQANPVLSVAALIWICLGVAGALAAWTAWRSQGSLHQMATLVTGVTAGQLALHMFYGDDGFFLYSLHFAPLLILLASFSSATKWRIPSLAGAVVLVGLTAWNNIAGIKLAIQLIPLPQ